MLLTYINTLNLLIAYSKSPILTHLANDAMIRMHEYVDETYTCLASFIHVMHIGDTCMWLSVTHMTYVIRLRFYSAVVGTMIYFSLSIDPGKTTDLAPRVRRVMRQNPDDAGNV